ncbi:MAG: amidophosphoribosyltransferase [Pelagibaca sp.]
MAQDTTPTNVAKQATQTTDDLRGALILLGTFGTNDHPQALLKLRGGKIATVSRGDLVKGETVVAIEEGRVALARNGTAHWLEMPSPRS